MSTYEERPKVVAILRGHDSAETAKVVNDYPHGSSRTQIRFWVERATKGPKAGLTRGVRQTQNPQTGRWNKPHASVYTTVDMWVVEYDNGHVDTAGFSLGDPHRWVSFYNTGIWPHLTDPERARIAYLMGKLQLRTPTAWAVFAELVHDMTTMSLPTLEEWRAILPDRYVDSQRYVALRAYLAADGPDLQANTWWLL
ncbi:hypothetical protein ACFVH4_15500 [Nocardia ignorata]|uniref:hypothetical protein n=1 Tax=Actinomycetes TaxID=1760 RepID=UPI003644A9BE